MRAILITMRFIWIMLLVAITIVSSPSKNDTCGMDCGMEAKKSRVLLSIIDAEPVDTMTIGWRQEQSCHQLEEARMIPS